MVYPVLPHSLSNLRRVHLDPGLWMGMRECPLFRMLCSVASFSSWSALSMNTCALPHAA